MTVYGLDENRRATYLKIDAIRSNPTDAEHIDLCLDMVDKYTRSDAIYPSERLEFYELILNVIAVSNPSLPKLGEKIFAVLNNTMQHIIAKTPGFSNSALHNDLQLALQFIGTIAIDKRAPWLDRLWTYLNFLQDDNFSLSRGSILQPLESLIQTHTQLSAAKTKLDAYKKIEATRSALITIDMHMVGLRVLTEGFTNPISNFLQSTDDIALTQPLTAATYCLQVVSNPDILSNLAEPQIEIISRHIWVYADQLAAAEAATFALEAMKLAPEHSPASLEANMRVALHRHAALSAEVEATPGLSLGL